MMLVGDFQKMWKPRQILVVLLGLAMSHSPAAWAKNLLANPGFESGGFHADARKSASSQEAGWTWKVTGDCYIRSETGEAYAFGPDGAAVVHRGKDAIRVATLRDGRAEVYQEVPVQPETVYWASVWVRTYDADGQGFGASGKDSAGLRLQELDANGQVTVEQPAILLRQANDGYERLWITFRTRAEAASVRITLEANLHCNHWHGYVNFDDCSLEAANSGLHIAGQSGPAVDITVASQDPLLQRTGQWCGNYLAGRGFAVDKQVKSQPPRSNSPLWVLETADQCPVAKSYGIDTAFLGRARGDAYVLATRADGDRPVVCIVGKDAVGTRSGLARLIAMMADVGTALTVPETTEYQEPFYAIRRMNLTPTGRITAGKDWTHKYADVLYTNWSDDRLGQYAEQLWLLGLNSVEVEEIRGYRAVYSDQDLAKLVTPKLRVLMAAARQNGLQVSQFIWGQSLFKEGDNLCWNDPRGKERQMMEKEFRRLAQTYGDLVDHIVVHVGDPGGCKRNGCDAYKTTQEIAMCLFNEYRKVNPKVTATLSTWANEGFWKGRPGARFLDETYSPKDLGIALHRWYDRDRARLVRDSGRACDIWGWYLSDFELSLDVNLATWTIDKNYSALPEQASRDIRAMSGDLCFHGWPQIINTYVTAQKMWSPRRDMNQMKREFCADTFGQANADAMMKLYNACEAYVHPEHYFAFAPETDCPPDAFGTADFNRRLRDALEAGKTVRLEENRPPQLTSATEPKAFHDYLLRNAALIQMFSEAAERITLAKSEHLPREKLQGIIDETITKAEGYKQDLDYRSLVNRIRDMVPPQ